MEVTTCAKPLRRKFWKILDQPAGPCGLQSGSLSLATAASWSDTVFGARVLNSDGAFLRFGPSSAGTESPGVSKNVGCRVREAGAAGSLLTKRMSPINGRQGYPSGEF